MYLTEVVPYQVITIDINLVVMSLMPTLINILGVELLQLTLLLLMVGLIELIKHSKMPKRIDMMIVKSKKLSEK
jgi:hypothetical protein